jgi:hypothetical protein
MIYYIKLYLVSLLAFFAVDLVWLVLSGRCSSQWSTWPGAWC